MQFTLVVDNFGVKYVGKEHALHLKNALQESYDVTTEWDGKRYIGITLEWDYKQQQVHHSMPGYVQKALQQFRHELKSGNKTSLSHGPKYITEPKSNMRHKNQARHH